MATCKYGKLKSPKGRRVCKKKPRGAAALGRARRAARRRR